MKSVVHVLVAVLAVVLAVWYTRRQRRGASNATNAVIEGDPGEAPWPNHAGWHALADGAVVLRENDEVYHLQVVDGGALEVPSGRLVICDPFAVLQREGNEYVDVLPGTHRVKVTLADVSGKNDGSHMREAYVSLLISNGEEVTRRPLIASPGGTSQTELQDDEFVGFGVDAGSGCLVDARSITDGMPPEEEWWDLFERDSEDGWFRQMDSEENIRPGLANIRLPLARDGEDLFLFHTGWGDGFYPIVGGFDARGRLVAIHVDLLVV